MKISKKFYVASEWEMDVILSIKLTHSSKPLYHLIEAVKSDHHWVDFAEDQQKTRTYH